MSKYIIPTDEFFEFLKKNRDGISSKTLTSIFDFVDLYLIEEDCEGSEGKKQKKKSFVEETKEFLKKDTDLPYIDEWVEHNKTFIEELDKLLKTDCSFKEIGDVLEKINKGSDSFVEKITKEKRKTKEYSERDFYVESKTTLKGNNIVHWKLVSDEETFEGFGSKGVGIAKILNRQGKITERELQKIINIHNFCKANGKNK